MVVPACPKQQASGLVKGPCVKNKPHKQQQTKDPKQKANKTPKTKTKKTWDEIKEGI